MKGSQRMVVIGAMALLAWVAADGSASEKPRLKAVQRSAGAMEDNAVLKECPLPERLVPLAMPFLTPPAPEGCDAAAAQTLKLRRSTEAGSFNAGLLEARAGACRQLAHLDPGGRDPVIAAFDEAQRKSLEAFGERMRAQWEGFLAHCPGGAVR